MENAHDFDVIVIGGGPAGSTLATFAAMDGHKVLLLEREVFPRHQIGESLLPATVHGICSMLGVRSEIESAGFPRKFGGVFKWGKSNEPWTFNFTERPDDPFGYAYQVERAKFDNILLNNARSKGVTVRMPCDVLEATREDGRVTGVRFKDENGTEKTVRAKYVADASGNRTRVSKGVSDRIYSKFFRNIAVFGYFEGGKRLPAPKSGNIVSVAFKDGWFWYIPLSDKLTSVGAVIAHDAADQIQKGPEAALAGYIDACPIIKDMLSDAKRVKRGMYGEIRIRKDYSYCNTKFWGPGIALIGDAACFVDPVFSSGVHLATYSALNAARAINSALRNPDSEERYFEEFEARYRLEFGKFYQFLIGFYDLHQDEGSYYWSARKILDTEERANDAFVRLIGGVSSTEPLFRSDAKDFFQAREGFGDWFQTNLVEGQSSPTPEAPKDKTKFDPDLFMAGFSSEIAQLQLRAAGKATHSERGLTSAALVVSSDGLSFVDSPR